VRNLALFSTSLKFEQLTCENATRYLNSETNISRNGDCPMSSPSLMQLDQRLLRNVRRKCPIPENLTAKTCKIVINLAVRSLSRKIHFRSKTKLATAPHPVRNQNSSFDISQFSAACRPMFENAARYLQSETKLVSNYYLPMSYPSLVQLDPLSFENHPEKVPR